VFGLPVQQQHASIAGAMLTMKQPRINAAYIRVSTEEQALEGYSLADQERRIRVYGKSNGLEIGKVYADHHTGKSRNRPGLKELLSDAEVGSVGTVITTEVDRLARRTSHALSIDEELRRFGAGCVFLEQNIDTTTDNGRFMFTIHASIAELERSQIRKRTRAGQAQKAREGRVSRTYRTTPLGYRYIPLAQRAAHEKRVELGQEPPHINGFVIVEYEAATVRHIFEGAASGLSLSTIAAQLTQERVPTKRRREHWEHSTLYDMIHRSHFWGKATYGYEKRVEISDDKTISRKNPNLDEVIYVPVPAIVTEELAMQAQAQCHRNLSFSKRNAKHEYLLSGGLLKCGECAAEGVVREDGVEYAMAGKCRQKKDHHKPYRYYRCQYYKDDGRRHHHSIPADDVDAKVWDMLDKAMTDPEMILKYHAALADESSIEATTLDAELTSVDSEIKRIDTVRNQLLNLHLEGSLDKARWQQKDTELSTKQEILETQRVAKADQRNRAVANILPMESVREACATLRECMENATFDTRQQIVRLLVTKVVATRERYRVEGCLPALTQVLADKESAIAGAAASRSASP